MAGYFLAAEDATSWPDAIVLCALIIAGVIVFLAVIK